ncbi:MAG: HlyD family efflux transporter periplasmic adaptor subunit [Firmicutes bacterium]|nr:HlyD family efflux transporter periplasmic adaptor subunit [Bacillota bacterium]
MKKSGYFILLCLLMFCTFYGIRYIRRPEKSQPAVSEIYENKIITSAYIVKTEQVYNAPAGGGIYHYIGEGTKVKKNSALATVYTGSVSEQTLAELNNVNQKIAEIQSSNSSYSFGANSQENIDIIKGKIIKSANKNSLESIESYKAQINSIVTGSVQDIRKSDISKLEAKKQQIEAEITSGKSDVYSQMAGVYSKNIDGLEETLTPKTVMSYKISDYDAIKAPENKTQNLVTGGEPICKVINNQTWYVMAAVSADTAAKLSKGQKITVRFPQLPGIEAEGILEYISTEDRNADKNVVIIKCEQYKEGVLSLRLTGVELVIESYEGYRVPMSAIRLVDGEKSIMVRTETGTILRKCKVLYTDLSDQTVIISQDFNDTKGRLKESDSIIIGEK